MFALQPQKKKAKNMSEKTLLIQIKAVTIPEKQAVMDAGEKLISDIRKEMERASDCKTFSHAVIALGRGIGEDCLRRCFDKPSPVSRVGK